MTGAQLREVRIELGLTQAQLGELLSPARPIPWNTVARMERGADVDAGNRIPVRPSLEIRLRALARFSRVRWPWPGKEPACEACGRRR